MSERDFENDLEADICVHLFTVSSAMVGVCLTVIGLIRVVITLGRIDTLADDLLSLDALFFLVACLLSYSALRTRSARRMHRVERIADVTFIAGMLLMTAICCIITYRIAMPAKKVSFVAQTTSVAKADDGLHPRSVPHALWLNELSGQRPPLR